MEIWRTRHSICAKGRGPDVGSTVPGEDVLNRGIGDPPSLAWSAT